MIRKKIFKVTHPLYGKKNIFSTHKDLVDFTLKVAGDKALHISMQICEMLVEYLADEMLQTIEET